MWLWVTSLEFTVEYVYTPLHHTPLHSIVRAENTSSEEVDGKFTVRFKVAVESQPEEFKVSNV